MDPFGKLHDSILCEMEFRFQSGISTFTHTMKRILLAAALTSSLVISYIKPVFLLLSQSAALAADLCLNENLTVQSLPYEKLRPVLFDAGQALDVTK